MSTLQKKYELLPNDTIEHDGRTLYRIRALRDFDTVKAGDLGGYLGKEGNLSHSDNAWVTGDAKVFDEAEVSGNAGVSDAADEAEQTFTVDEFRETLFAMQKILKEI